jgi:alpha-mannosidase
MYYVWNTVILKGNYSYEFALYPFEGSWTDAGLHRKSLEYNFPCISFCSVTGTGKLGSNVQLFDLSSPDLIMSALYLCGGKPIIRFYESQGKFGQLKSKYIKGKADFTEVDLTGTEKESLDSKFNFQPWQIKSFRLD